MKELNKKKVIILSGVVLFLCLFFGLLTNSYYARHVEFPKIDEFGMQTSGNVESLGFFTCLGGLFKEGVKGLYIAPFSAKVFFVSAGTLLSLIGLVVFITKMLNAQKENRREGHEHGKKHIATRKDYQDFKKKFTDKCGNNVLFSQHVALAMDNKKTNRVTNTLVIGGTGTGKTFKYIKTNLAQFNCSRIITDPSGDIFRDFAPALIEQGKNVYLFNIKDFALSNHYNPLLNVYDAEGRIDNQKVDILVDLYMDNASEGNAQGGNDPFWPKSEKAFLTGVIYYVLENDDIPIEDKCFRTVLEKVQLARVDSSSRNPKDTETILTKEIREWQGRMEAEGRSIMTPLYYDTFLIAPEKTANTILITTAVDLQIFSNPNVDRITRYNTRYPDLNIDLDDIPKTETYLFLSIPQANKAYNFLIAMIYSQLFSRLYDLGDYILTDKWVVCRQQGFPVVNPFDDKETAEAFKKEITTDNIIELPYINGTSIFYLVWKNKVWKKAFLRKPLEDLIKNIKEKDYPIFNTNEYWGAPALPMHVELMLDEFKNIGKIPNFDTIIATCRKYRIGTHVVIQDIAQLKELYPDESHQTILANVDTTLFLGSPLPEDKEYIQKMVGKTTIPQKSTSGSGKSGISTSYTPTQVDLMSIDEIEAINMHGRDDCIVLIRDVCPFVDKKLPFTKHPNYKLIKGAGKHINTANYFANNKEVAI